MKAAEQGDGDARFFIAVSYSEGWGVAKDEAQSSFWLLKAAVHGHTNFKRFLGRAYAERQRCSSGLSTSLFLAGSCFSG